MSKLSERVRPGSEAAEWVVDDIKQLEAELQRYRDADCAVLLQRVGLLSSTVRGLQEDLDELREGVRSLVTWCDTQRNAPEVTTLGMVQAKLRGLLDEPPGVGTRIAGSSFNGGRQRGNRT